MGAVADSKKIFQLDVLSLVLACVISMLFTKGVVEFLNNSSKKQDRHASAFYSPQSDYEEEELIICRNNHLQTPLKSNRGTEYDFLMFFQEFRTIRICLAAGAEVEKQIFQPTNWYLDQSYNNTLPSRWGPTLSIAHCKLVI